MMKLKNVPYVLCLAGLFLASQSAQAYSTINADYLGAAYGSYVSGNINPSPNTSGSANVSIGGFKMKNITPTPAPSFDFVGPPNSSNADKADEFVAWCVDPLHWLQDPSTYYVGGKSDMVSNFSLRAGETNASATSRVNDLQVLANQFYSIVDTSKESAAFQIATWTILYGNDSDGNNKYDFNLGTSAFKVKPKVGGTTTQINLFNDAASLATTYLNTLGASSNGNFKITYLFDNRYPTFTNDPTLATTQDVVVFTPNPVPLPPAAALMLSGVGLFGWARRKMSKA